MTHEQFVTLETARLAKQAGFDWECSTFYTETFDYANQERTGRFEFRRNDNLRYRNPNDDRNSFVNHKGTLLEYKFEMYSAPTQSVLQRWLREVKSLYISMIYMSIHNEWHCKAESKDNCILVNYIEPTYESALEAGLQKCLTLLIKKQ